jgi:hypothetical protein
VTEVGDSSVLGISLFSPSTKPTIRKVFCQRQRFQVCSAEDRAVIPDRKKARTGMKQLG